MKRFSKAKLLMDLKDKADKMQKEWKFTQHNGWAQVANKGEEANRAYGKWDELWTIIWGIEGGYLGI